MPAPSTASELLALVEKSAILDADAFQLLTRQIAQPVVGSAGEMAERLIEGGYLTKFQAGKLLAGRWRGFMIAEKYKLLDRLGAGGMGAVYLCEHVLMGRRVALKVLPIAQAEDKVSLARFYREARAVARLDHPNIVRAHDIDHEDKLHFLVLEFVDGCNLHEFVNRNGPMSAARAAHCIRQAALGLQHAHEAGLVHRDIKPGNLLMDREGTVKLLDLGLAQFFGEENSAFVKEYENGFVIGTADFLSPEQTVQSQVDIRADIYSLGCTFYFLLAGKSPFHEGTPGQKMIWHQVRRPRPIRSLRSDVPESVAQVLDKMLAKEPGRRQQTPAEVARDLAAAIADPVPPPTLEEMPPRISGSGRPSTQTQQLTAPESPGAIRAAEPSSQKSKVAILPGGRE